MGAWGTGPFDNDDAADMVAKIANPVRRVANGNGNDGDYYLARAAAQFLLVSHGTDILGGPGLAPVLRALARMRTDREWLMHWNSPRKIAGAIDKELLDVLDRMHRCKGCRRSIKKPEWAELEILVATARSAPVPKSGRPKRTALKVRTTRALVRGKKRKKS